MNMIYGSAPEYDLGNIEHVALGASGDSYETTNGLIHPLILGLEIIIKVMYFV